VDGGVRSNSEWRDRLRPWLDTEAYADAPALAAGLRLAFDLGLLCFFLVTTFVTHQDWVVIADYAIGAVLLLEWGLRLWISRSRLAMLAQPTEMLDLVVILSLMAPSVTENFVFLRVLRAMRLLRSYRVLTLLRERSPRFRAHEQVWFSATHLMVFVFLISAAVYALQVRVNPHIDNYLDALYFTITTLTTTGFGDIVMVGSSGRMLSVIIMIVGVSLFLRLIQAIFRPAHIDYECPDCGLTRHDPDAVHCKHCGRVLHIRTEGFDS